MEPFVPSVSPASVSGIAALSTFLITDIEGSTRLWEEHGATMGVALALHDQILRTAVEGCQGTVIKTTGDGLLAIFGDSIEAVAAATAAQRGLRDSAWGPTGPLRVRMALHAGTAESRDGDYFGPALNRSARILSIGHGGQILLSAVAAMLTGDRLAPAAELRDLGSHRLRDLDRPEQVFQLISADLPAEFPPLRSLSTRRSNLPVQLTSFVGRDREVTEVRALLERHRLVTLIGTGGTGKTRLMLEAAGRAEGRFVDGIWLAELASLREPAQIPSEIARALGAPEVPGQPGVITLSEFLADKDVLLLLDNAEHLVDGVAEIVGVLLNASSRLRILTTSREALAVAGEAVLQVQSLSCPVIGGSRGSRPLSLAEVEAIAGTEAVRLFAERANAVVPGFAVEAGNVSAIAEICSRLDGIPLAIELAAVRVATMSPDDIAKRLGDRFRLLAGGRRTAVPRQQTLHALVDWSWDLLSDDDRRLLRRLSIFAGGWTVPSAAQIVGDGPDEMDHLELIDNLARLVDRSLVMVDRGPTTRYRMLETIRQYAREKLIEAYEVAALAARHLATFGALLVAAESDLRGPTILDWLDRLDADIENIGAALEWGLEADPWKAVEMATALLAYRAVRVTSADTDESIETAIQIARDRTVGHPEADRDDQILVARLMGEASRLWAMSGRTEQAMEWAREALELAEAADDVVARLYALGGLAVATVFSGGGRDNYDRFSEIADLAEQSQNWWVLGLAAGFGGASMAMFDGPAGEALVVRAEAAAKHSGSPYVIGAVAMAHGRLLDHTGRLDQSVARYETAIARFTELGDERFALAARSDLAHAFRRGGRLDEAMARYRETILNWVHLGHRGAVANQLENFAYVAIERSQAERAVRLLGAAAGIREASGSKMAFDEIPEMNAYLGRAHAAMSADTYEQAWAAGGALTQAEAVAEAIAG
ncbi:MAG: AAA family ATPase [Chloroflexota bacterium]